MAKLKLRLTSRGSSPARSAAAAMVACVALTALPGEARADRTIAAILPFELNGGLAVPLGRRATDPPLIVFGAPLPIPISITGANATEEHNRAIGLRLMVMPELLIGTQHAMDTSEVMLATARVRVGLRFSLPLTGRYDMLTGLGSTIDFWPVVVPSLSPELGVRVLLKRCEHDFSMCSGRYLHILVRAELDGSDERPEAGVLLGWASY